MKTCKRCGAESVRWVCNPCNNTYMKAYYKYRRMIDDIIDKPVGKGSTLFEAVGDGNSHTKVKSYE